jgi:hypothetical protein
VSDDPGSRHKPCHGGILITDRSHSDGATTISSEHVPACLAFQATSAL